MNRQLPELLAARLAEPLPGPMVGSRFEPRPPHEWRHDRAPSGARPAAVLLLLYPLDDRWHVPLTLRPESMAALPTEPATFSSAPAAPDPPTLCPCDSPSSSASGTFGRFGRRGPASPSTTRAAVRPMSAMKSPICSALRWVFAEP